MLISSFCAIGIFDASALNLPSSEGTPLNSWRGGGEGGGGVRLGSPNPDPIPDQNM